MVVKADITIDIDKQVGNLQNLTNIYNARVGDSNTPLTVLWRKNGMTLNLKGLHAFIAGKVGDGSYNAETDKVDFPVGSPVVKYEDDGSGTLDDGQSGLTTLLIPKQMWAKTGLFFGYIGLKDENGSVFTSKDIFFKILGNVLDAGIEINYFIGDFDKALAKAEKELEDKAASFDQTTARALQDLHDKYLAEIQKTEDTLGDTQVSIDAMNSQVKASRAELTNINDHLSGVEQQIAINDIVTIPQHTEDLKSISNAIDERLANVKTAPVAVKNAQVLLQSYPNGADGIFITADTGHKWLWLSGAWADCGEYQAVGIEDELIQPLEQQQATDQQNIATNYSLINQNSENITENTVHLQEVQGAGQYTQIHLTDQNGSHITNEFGANIVGNKWLPMVDKTLTQSDLPADAKAVGDAINQAVAFDPTKYGIPVLYLWDNEIETLKDKTKTLENEVTYKFPLFHIQGTLKEFKVQGQSSAALPKKGYTLNFDQDFAAFPSFGNQHKYVIKANYTDASQALNVVNAKLWGKIRRTHYQVSDALQDSNNNYLSDNHGNHIIAETDPQLAIGGNCGTEDGFPIAVSINNKYWGLYSFTMLKGAFMAKMPHKAGYAIASMIWSPQGALQKETNFKDQMELTFCGTKDTQWALNSINKLIDAVMASYDRAEDFDSAVSPLVDLDSAYDYYIYSVLINNDDGIFRNYLLQTFDGKKWYFAAYDLDETFGRTPEFLEHTLADSDTNNWRDQGATFENLTGSNQLMYQLWKFHKAEVLSRAKDLANGVMSASAVDTAFIDYVRNIPQIALDEEIKVWPGTPNTSVDNVNRLGRWYMQRIEWLNKRYLDSLDPQSSELDQLKAKVANLEHITAGK